VEAARRPRYFIGRPLCQQSAAFPVTELLTPPLSSEHTAIPLPLVGNATTRYALAVHPDRVSL